jgi:hypothetical protein
MMMPDAWRELALSPPRALSPVAGTARIRELADDFAVTQAGWRANSRASQASGRWTSAMRA